MSQLKGMKSTLAWARTFPPSQSEGWAINFIERQSRYWITAKVGKKDERLFEQGNNAAWQWVKPCQFVRWFTDGEKRYAKLLWPKASVYLKHQEYSKVFGHHKVWREGLEVAMKVKSSQGRQRIEWVKSEHPYTAISPKSEVHANHNEAHNSAIRRRGSAYRRRQNLYAKTKQGLQRSVTVQKLIHNWVRPHWSLAKGTTPAMAMGFYHRPVKMEEFLCWRGLPFITH